MQTIVEIIGKASNSLLAVQCHSAKDPSVFALSPIYSTGLLLVCGGLTNPPLQNAGRASILSFTQLISGGVFKWVFLSGGDFEWPKRFHTGRERSVSYSSWGYLCQLEGCQTLSFELLRRSIARCA